MSKLKLPVIIAIVVAAAAAGLFMSGMIGGKSSDGPVKKHVIEPVPLAQEFTVNLADAEGQHFALLNVALQLEPMDAEEYATWSGANAGGHGGGGEAPGPAKLAAYPKFADAINAVTATFTSQELMQPEGKSELKQALLERFAQIAEQDTADYEAGAHEEGHVGPPYHVMDVFFPKYIIS